MYYKPRTGPYRLKKRPLRHQISLLDGADGQQTMTRISRELRAYRYAAQAVVGSELGGEIGHIALGTHEHNDGAFWKLTQHQCRADNPFALRVLITVACVDGVAGATTDTGDCCFAVVLSDPEVRSCADAMRKAMQHSQKLDDIIRYHYDYVEAAMGENRFLIPELAKMLLQKNRIEREEIMGFINNARTNG